MSTIPNDKLTRAEEEIMHYFWSYGANTVSNIIKHMEEPKPPHSSVSTICRILENKGFLSHNTYGRTYEYYPLISKSDYSKYSITKLIRNYFGGSINGLVSFLIQENDLTLSEIENLKREISEKDKTQNP